MHRRSQRFVWAAAAATAVLLAVLILWIWPMARQTVELAAESGVMQLRDPLRPIRGTTRVLIVALDGVGDGELRQAIDSGHLPGVARLVGRRLDDDIYERAYAVPDALSVLPSSTMSAWATVFTGRPPGETGVPGNEWYAREERRFYAPAPVSVQEHDHVVAMYAADLLGASITVPTLFERLDLRAHVGLMPVFRGADLLAIPSLGDVGGLFSRLAAGLGEDEVIDREPYAALDEGAAGELVALVEEHGLPDVQVVYFPGMDLYTHGAEPPLARQQQYLRDIVDPALERILERYVALVALDDTYVIFVSDHGHTPVLKDDRHALATDPETDPPALVTRAGYRLRPFEIELDDDDQDYQVVFAYQGAFAMVYIADRSTCPAAGDRCDWMAPARWEEDILPLAMAFDRANRHGELVPELQDTLDLIFVREGRGPDDEPLPFQIWDGTRVVPTSEYLDRHPRPDLLRLEERLEDLATGPFGHRAGEVLLLARSGMDRPIEERFYFSSVNHSWHGGPHAQDSRIPILVAHPAQSGQEIQATVGTVIGSQPSQLDVVPLLEALLRAGGDGGDR